MLIQIRSVDPLAAIGRQLSIASAAGIVAADILPIGQGKAEIQGVSVAQVIIRKAFAGIEHAVHRVHPPGALGIIKFTQRIRAGLSGQADFIGQNFGPQILRNFPVVHHTAPGNPLQIKAVVRRPGILHLIAKLLQHGQDGVRGRFILLNLIGIRTAQGVRIQTYRGGIQQNVGRTNDASRIDKGIGHLIPQEGGISPVIPGQNRDDVDLGISLHRVLKIQLVLVYIAAGRRRHRLPIQGHNNIVRIDDLSFIRTGPNQERKVPVGHLPGKAVEIGGDHRGMLSHLRIVCIGLSGGVKNNTGCFLQGFISLFQVERNVVILLPGQLRLIIPPRCRKVGAVCRSPAVAELHPQVHVRPTVCNIGVEGQNILFQLVIGQDAVHQIRDDFRLGVILRAFPLSGAFPWIAARLIAPRAAGLRIVPFFPAGGAGLRRRPGRLRLIRRRRFSRKLRLLRGPGVFRRRGHLRRRSFLRQFRLLRRPRLFRGFRFLRRLRFFRGLRLLRRLRLFRRFRLLPGGIGFHAAALGGGKHLGRNLRLLVGNQIPGLHLTEAAGHKHQVEQNS